MNVQTLYMNKYFARIYWKRGEMAQEYAGKEFPMPTKLSFSHHNPFNSSNKDEGMSYFETPMKWAKLGYFGSHPNSLRVFVLFNCFPKGSLVPAIYNISRLMQVLHTRRTKVTITTKPRRKIIVTRAFENFQKRGTEESYRIFASDQ